MNSRRLAILVGAIVVVIAVAVSGVVLAQGFLAGDDVPALGLDTPGPSSTAIAAPPTDPASAAPTSPGAEPGATPAAADLAGSWNIASGVAGYRVRETFLDRSAESDAVGRTEGVDGTLVISGTADGLSLDSASLTVDMTSLASDESRRDRQLTGRGIETDRFPSSTFELAGPVAIPADFGSADVAVPLPGKLTLHGVTRDVEIAAQARLEADGTVVVAGSLPILFADYEIEAPNVAGLIAVQDNGSLEFRVVLARG